MSPSGANQQEDQQYMEKLKQLSKYIEPLRRMINKIDKNEGMHSGHALSYFSCHSWLFPLTKGSLHSQQIGKRTWVRWRACWTFSLTPTQGKIIQLCCLCVSVSIQVCLSNGYWMISPLPDLQVSSQNLTEVWDSTGETEEWYGCGKHETVLIIFVLLYCSLVFKMSFCCEFLKVTHWMWIVNNSTKRLLI